MLQQLQGRAQRDDSQLATGTNYQGNIYTESFLSQVGGLPDEENASLYITNLSSGDYKAFFDLIYEGAVYSLHFVPPSDGYATWAADLTFMSPQAAGAFFNRANNGQILYHLGKRLRVMRNRVGRRAQNIPETRVLLIDVPAWLVTWPNMKAHFDAACVYGLDRWSLGASPDPSLVRMEVRFARVNGQAQSCKQKLDWYPAHQGVLFTQYGPDPCDPRTRV
ncbi:uncharacterized protein LY89DRAFT_64000 [Mollisia scopiformis]|uniref:RRM domain-containing protein n=1 Tax=Mollisia scopiformis TaxID=149040 RepID=A0A194X9D5_MOLSC|nr:uncharacterized protein LY89DRAFT_64000 [Mollisia scopiformis]KUJ16781.1 hypothetical protein LY89DRAFT_64000 [Mollisia scopiformis]